MALKVATRNQRIGDTATPTCIYWLKGRCNRNPCRFLHSLPPTTGHYNASTDYHHAKKTLSKCNTKFSPYDKGSITRKHNSSSSVSSNRNSGDGTHVAEALISNCNTKSSSYDKDITRKHNSSSVSNQNSGDGTHVAEALISKKPSQSICRYWTNGNCVYGDRCQNLHSWFCGDGFSPIAELQGHKKLVTGMTLPNGSDKFYSGSTDGTLRTWDCHTGQCANVINLGAEVSSMISEGPWNFIALQNVIKAWNTQTGSQFTLDGPKGRVLAMTVGKDTLFAGAEDGIIYAWKCNFEANSPFEPVASLSGHTKDVVCLTIGCDRLYSGSKDQSIKVWDIDTLECKMTLNGHTDVITSLICWDYYLLSGSADRTIKVWVDTGNGTLEVTYSHPVENGVVALCGMSDAQDKHILFCSSGDNSVQMYELPSFAKRGQLFSKRGVLSVEIGSGGLFFTGDGTGSVKVWKWSEEPKVATSS